MIRKDEERFRALVVELDEIRQGKWDSQLVDELKKNPSMALEAEAGTTEVASSSTDPSQQHPEGETPIPDTTAPSSLSTPSSTSLSDKQDDTKRAVNLTETEQPITHTGASEIDPTSNLMDMDIEDVVASTSTTRIPIEFNDMSFSSVAAEDIEMEDVFSRDPLSTADHESPAPPTSQESTGPSEGIKGDKKPTSEPEANVHSSTTASDLSVLETMEDVTLAKDNSETSNERARGAIHAARGEDEEQGEKDDEGKEIKEIKSENETKESVDEEQDDNALEDHVEDGPDVEDGTKADEQTKIKSEETAVDGENQEDGGHDGAEDGATSADEEETPSTPKSGRRSRKSKAVPAKRKRRSARGGGGGGDHEEYDSSDSETVDSVQTNMSDQLARTQMDDKKWKKILMMIWTDIANHRYGAVFMQPIKEHDAPGYSYMIKRPMDLKSIKERIRDGVSNDLTGTH